MGHVATPEPFPTGRRAWPHVVTLEPFRTERRVWSHRTHGDIGAIPFLVACPVPRGTWRCQSSLALGAGLELQGHTSTPEPFPAGCEIWRCGIRLKFCAQGYPVCRVPTIVFLILQKYPCYIIFRSIDRRGTSAQQ
jgi:hypothetical protein